MTLLTHQSDSAATGQPLTEPAPPTSLDAARRARSERVTELLAAMQSCRDTSRRQELANKVVLEHSQTARAVAARFRNRGVEQADLEQIATLGLIKAVHRWEPGRCGNFLQYAVPTMTGEIKRYFRDRTSMIRPNRRVQEIRAAMHQFHQHDPEATTAHLAERLGVAPDDISEARQATQLMRPCSLDAPAGEGQEWSDLVGHDESGYDAVENRILLRSIFSALTDQERTVVRLRFFDDLTQLEIAARIGVSQMQVSRILGRISEKARHQAAGALDSQAG